MAKKIKFNTQYDYDKVTGKHFNKPSMTDRSFSFDADINNIINGMGLVPQCAQPLQFGLEFDTEFYQKALNVVADAKSEFEKLPSHIRKEFNNDPMQLVKFIDSPSEENAKKGVKLGIFKPEILEAFKPAQTAIKPTVSPETATVTEGLSQ